MIGRLGAIDYGTKRVGLATSDALGITVKGLPTVVRTGPLEADVAAVAAALAARDVTGLVVGLPLHADGQESEMSREARVFGDRVAAALGVKVVYVDETLTSWEAEQAVKASGRRLRDARVRGEVDRAVAVALLRGHLEALTDTPPPKPPAPPDDDPYR